MTNAKLIHGVIGSILVIFLSKLCPKCYFAIISNPVLVASTSKNVPVEVIMSSEMNISTMGTLFAIIKVKLVVNIMRSKYQENIRPLDHIYKQNFWFL